MSTKDIDDVREQYRDASFDYDINSSSQYTAETFGIFAVIAFAGTFVFDVSGFDQVYVWLARFTCALIAAIAFVFASRYEKAVRSAEKTLQELKQGNPDLITKL